QLRDEARRRDVSSALIERDPLLSGDGSGLQDSKRMPSKGRTESRRGRSLRDVERALDLSLEQQHSVLCRQAFQSQAAHLAPQAPLASRHGERGSGSDIQHLFQLVLRQVHIIEKDQRLLVLKATPDLRLRGFADLVALVEGLEDQLQEIAGRLMPRRQV